MCVCVCVCVCVCLILMDYTGNVDRKEDINLSNVSAQRYILISNIGYSNLRISTMVLGKKLCMYERKR